MSQFYQIPNFHQLCRHYSGETSSDEDSLIVAWRDQSSENQRRYLQVRRVWALTFDAPAADLDFDPNEAWRSVATKYRVDTLLDQAKALQKKQRRPKILQLPRWMYAAAASLLLLAIGFTAYRIATANPMITVVADASSTKQITLEDGTKVILNKNAQLQYPTHFEETDRTVILRGDAMFEVARNPKKPFKIDAGQSVVEVLGTIFRLKAADQSTELAVKEGKVGLDQKQSGGKLQRTTLKAGQKALLKGGKVEVRPAGPNDFALGTGTLIFENASLAEILSTLESFYDKKIQVAVADPSVLDTCQLTLTVEQLSWDQAVDALKTILLLEYTTTAEGIRITSISCGLE